MQFRGTGFRQPYVNVGGTAGNLPVLRSTLEAMLRTHKPKAVILGLDFWWFMPQWNRDPFEDVPPTSGSYNYGFENLKKPWAWLLDGKISPAELFAPLWGGFRDARFGIMAQQTDDGFGLFLWSGVWLLNGFLRLLLLRVKGLRGAIGGNGRGGNRFLYGFFGRRSPPSLSGGAGWSR